MVLVTAFAVQEIWDWRCAWLSALQEGEAYKRLTGLALVVLLAMQWRLSAARMKGAKQRARRLLASHPSWGALAPLLFYVHAESLGHAYIRVMSFAFFALVSLGLLYRPIVWLKRPWLTASWLVVHVGLAAMLVFFVGYHAFNAFYYE